MAYSKSDFLDWDEDLDLDFLLGDYTKDELQSSSDDEVTCTPKVKDIKSTAKVSNKIYNCDRCDKSYSSISGIRGHMRTKHGVQNVKAKTFVSQHREWTEKLNRGGLKVPSDSFFLLVREFETVCKRRLEGQNPSNHTLNRVVLKEKICEDGMVKHYAEKLKMGHLESSILERLTDVFLTIRGNSYARQTKMKMALPDKAQTSKSLRHTLKEISVCK